MKAPFLTPGSLALGLLASLMLGMSLSVLASEGQPAHSAKATDRPSGASKAHPESGTQIRPGSQATALAERDTSPSHLEILSKVAEESAFVSPRFFAGFDPAKASNTPLLIAAVPCSAKNSQDPQQNGNTPPGGNKGCPSGHECVTYFCGCNGSCCCPRGFRYLNHCDCQCYSSSSDINCSSYSRCN